MVCAYLIVPVTTSQSIPAAASKRSRWRRALGFAFPYRKAVLGILLITLFLASVNAAEPLVMKFIFDNLSSSPDLAALGLGVAGLLAIGLVRELFSALSNWMTWHTRLGIHYALLEATVERLHRMPLSLYRNQGVGAIMTKLDRSIQGFIGAVSQILFNIFPAIVYLIISIFVMLKLNWKLAVLVLAFAPLPAVIAALAAPVQTRRERTLLDQWSKIYSRFNEVLSGIVTVRSFAMEETEKKRFLNEVDKANAVVIRGVGVDTGFTAAENGVILLARIAAIGLGGFLVFQGEITLGTLMAFLGYVGGLFGPLQGLSSIYTTVQKASVSLEEIFSILDFQEHLPDQPDAQEITAVRGEVIFEGVKFNYGHREQAIIRGIDLVVKPGETLALVGPSGAGKTTLMALLMRFYDPNEGRILLDGRDIRSVKQKSLRRSIGVVLQDPLLFNEPIKSNIAFGRPEASMAQIIAAAKAANAHDFISATPDGYDTMVGERGSRLSVGERQRIAIARALIKDPPIIVLDEATSSLDAESEALVQDAMDRLMKGRTTFIIAHRLATVVHADRIIVLRGGRITESGKHDELMRLDGYYASLVRKQTRGLIPNGEPAALAW
jgi:ATP-binding cassette, subfamily B, bacterial